MANAIRRSRAGLSDPNRPIGSFLFLGPDRRGQDRAGPGAGRVPLRRRAGHGPHRHGRVPGEAHRLALVGAPPGYVGYDEGGQLTEAVRRRPYAVVLLDEIEKAHPDVFNMLLQVLDDGRLTDGQGRTVDFTNTRADHDVEPGGGAGRLLQARVHQSHRRDRAVPPLAARTSARSSTSSWSACGSAWRSGASAWSSPSRPGPGWPSGLRPRRSGPGRCGGCSSAGSRTRSPWPCSRAKLPRRAPPWRSDVAPDGDGVVTRPDRTRRSRRRGTPGPVHCGVIRFL